MALAASARPLRRALRPGLWPGAVCGSGGGGGSGCGRLRRRRRPRKFGELDAAADDEPALFLEALQRNTGIRSCRKVSALRPDLLEVDPGSCGPQGVRAGTILAHRQRLGEGAAERGDEGLVLRKPLPLTRGHHVLCVELADAVDAAGVGEGAKVYRGVQHADSSQVLPAAPSGKTKILGITIRSIVATRPTSRWDRLLRGLGHRWSAGLQHAVCLLAEGTPSERLVQRKVLDFTASSVLLGVHGVIGAAGGTLGAPGLVARRRHNSLRAVGQELCR
mmetsp:Transcript_39162/g.105969  ORF Transcript_39162/g.105969 Transcript_39162/m.105969 type:complete len:277 (+) Transcript_39162:2-832(+)